MTKWIPAAGVLLLLGCFPADGSAQTVTGFKTGEQVTGMTKQCFYNALGSTHTLTLSSVAICPVTIQVASSPRPPAPTTPPPPPRPQTVTAFLKGEQVTGMTKQCFYDGLGSGYTRTIRSVDLCPLSIQVRIGG
jgi:hypothetical protein